MGKNKKYHLLEIDSTFCKVHKSAVGTKKKFENQAIGISRGGKTTKIHACVNENFQLIKIILMGGQMHDSEVATDLLKDVELADKTVLADKAYSSEQIRSYIDHHNDEFCIPDKSNAVNEHNFDAELYKPRNIIERFFNRIKEFRHIATRYDKLAICFSNFVLIAAFLIQI